MPVNAERIAGDIAAIAAFTLTPGHGAGRPTFSLPWRQARDHVIAEAGRAGCHHRIDAAGNVHIRPASVGWSTPCWLAGSHLDSVPGGGDYDGVLGVVAALEVLRTAAEDGRHSLPFETVIFAEEEGTTFGLGMLGSQGWIGTLDAKALTALKNSEGENYWQAGKPHQADPAQLTADRMRPKDWLGFLEVHIEQGAGMWKRKESVALVTGINGRWQYLVTLSGVANHAGSTGMEDRHDALAGAAEVIAGLESFAPTLGPRVVATVGKLSVEPNVFNVIPASVTFTIDLRADADSTLVAADSGIRKLVKQAADKRGLSAEMKQTESLPAVALSAKLADRFRAAAARLSLPKLPETTSGALHDAAILAPIIPTIMLFVSSKDGISHNPGEFSRTEDMATATRLLYEAVTQS
jgi:hydantoinase/carbamoylase family amidase